MLPASDSGVTGVPHSAQRMRIWDLPTRLFHWLLAASVIALVLTGRQGVMEWHFRIGYLVMALLVFRILWGFAGGHWSRFANFICTPRSLLAYLRGRSDPKHLIGHTPAGTLSVLAILTVLIVQVASGLMADDEIAAAGPLTRFVSGATVNLATGWHKEAGQALVIALACLHVLAVLGYALFRRDPLVRPMISGDKILALTAKPSRDDAASRLLALVLFALCCALAYWVASLRA